LTESRSKKLLLEAITGNKKLLVAPGITRNKGTLLVALSLGDSATRLGSVRR